MLFTILKTPYCMHFVFENITILISSLSLIMIMTKPNIMALAKILLILLILPHSLEAFSHVASTSEPDFHTLACSGIENQGLCLEIFQNAVRNARDGRSDPISALRAALRMTLKETQLAIESLTKFSTLSINPREQIALQDCQELLDFSVSELAWSLAEMNKIRAGDQNLYYEGDLKAWLSAALSNQDTCLDGFEGTDKRIENYIRGSLTQVTQLIDNVLSMYTQYHTLPFKPSRNSTNQHRSGSSKFPKWMTVGDQELLKKSPVSMHVDVVVALDGSGHYQTITEAIAIAPNHGNRRYVIHVKKGIYRENVDMKKKKTNIMLVGDGIGATVVTGDRNFMQGWTTFRSATFAVSGKGFIAKDMTFRNTAGPQRHQAVALRVDSDQSAFYRCSMEGYQDTLYAHSLRQFYRECNIYGTIDFIAGNSAIVLQNCKIFTRVPLPLQKITITAQGRKNPNQDTGFSIHNSYILATQPAYLGRPWKLYSRTVYMNTFMNGMIQPQGWLEWNGTFALDTLWYGEYKNYGPGASLSGRVKWPGYHIIKDVATASSFTAGQFIDAMAWLPATGIKFKAGISD